LLEHAELISIINFTNLALSNNNSNSRDLFDEYFNVQIKHVSSDQKKKSTVDQKPKDLSDIDITYESNPLLDQIKAEKVIDVLLKSNILNLIPRHFNDQTIEFKFYSLTATSFTMTVLFWILKSLEVDCITPSDVSIVNRLKEF